MELYINNVNFYAYYVNVEFYLKKHMEFNFEDIEFYTKLDFVKIKFQKKNILLNNLKRETNC